MKVIYKNSQGREIDLNKKPIKFGGGDIFNYEWKPVSNERQFGTQIRQFNKEAKELTVNVYLTGSDADRRAGLNKLLESCEYDVMTQANGKLYFMPDNTPLTDLEYQYYISCYLTEVEVENAVSIGGDTAVKLKYYCFDSFWFRESKPLFFGRESGASAGDFLDYPHGYAYDYSRQMSAAGINNTNFISTDFRAVIHGPAVEPTIYIDGHAYGIEYTLTDASQYIVIDTVTKTVTLNDNGDTTSLFDYRNRDSYIFEPIAPGENPVSWNNSFTWDIKLIEKRSAPKWT